MDDISLRKRQLDDKLAQEKNILAFLKDSLEKTDQITGNMLDILSKFEVRIHKLEDTIVPVHRETDDLQRRQANIEKCLSALDHVISYHHVSTNVEHVIRESPTGELDAYIKNLERVLDAIEFFNQNNPNCMELSSLTSLRDYGRDSLEKEFRLILNRHSRPVPVEMIMELVESETENSKENVKLEHLSEKVLEDLCTITHWLNGPGYDEAVDFMSVYAQIRSNSLVRSLHGLKDSFGSKVKTASGGINTPTRKGTAKRRELRRVPSKSEHHGLPRRTSAIPTDVGTSKEEEEEIDGTNYIVFCKSLLRLIQSERELMKSIIPEQSQSTTFDTLIQAAMEDFIAEGESIINILKRHFGKHNYSAIQQVFPILKAFNAIQPDFYVTLQETFHNTQRQFPTLIHALESVSAKALDDFADGIKHGPDKHSNMPSDGTVHELTRNTLIFTDLNRLVEDFDEKRKQEEDAERERKEREDYRQRRRAQAASVLAAGINIGERVIGVVTPHCTFRNLTGGAVVVTTLMVLRRSPSMEEFVNAFEGGVLPLGNFLRAISEGSIRFTVQARNISALEKLWQSYQDNTLQTKLQEFLVTEEIELLAGGAVTLTVHIDEDEYRNALFDFIKSETEGLKMRGKEKGGLKDRASSDSDLSRMRGLVSENGKDVAQVEEFMSFERKSRVEEFLENLQETHSIITPTTDSGEGTWRSAPTECGSEEGAEGSSREKLNHVEEWITDAMEHLDSALSELGGKTPSEAVLRVVKNHIRICTVRYI